MSLRCRVGIHDHRDENGWPLPTWWSFCTPHTYRCTRCGNEVTLTPPHWEDTRREIDVVTGRLAAHRASTETHEKAENG